MLPVFVVFGVGNCSNSVIFVVFGVGNCSNSVITCVCCIWCWELF
jgi:hypothetical protein